jgi:hypothetical protein
MQLDPFIWFAVGLVSVFGLVLGWASWITRDR